MRSRQTPEPQEFAAPLWVTLRTCAALGPDLVGGKAHTLGRLLERGLLVPDGVCLSVQLFRAVLQLGNLGAKIRQQLQQLQQNPVLTGKVLERVRTLLQEAVLPPEVTLAVEEAVTPLLAHGPVVVRSSAPPEDGDRDSYAGIYASELNVTTIQGVLQAIRRCWMALFTERAWFYSRGAGYTDMAVIVQRQVSPLVAGVMFTQGVHAEEQQCLVELAAATTDAITSGRGRSERYTLCRDGPGGDGLAPMLKAALLEAATHGEQVVDGPADLEWSWDGAHLHYLQVRPATQVRRRQLTETTWFEQENPALLDYDLGKCQPFLIRQMQKKVWYRRFCRQSGLPTFKTLYLFYDEAGLKRLGEELVRTFDMEFVRIRWGDSKALCHRSDLLAALQAGTERNAVGRLTCAEIAEVIMPVLEGFSSPVNDGEVLIEAFPAKVPGIKEGSLPPTRFKVSAAGSVGRQGGPLYDRAAHFDTGADRWRLDTVPPYAVELTDTEAGRIAEVTRTLRTRFGEIRLEWYLSAGEIWVKDLSVESHSMQVAAAHRSGGVPVDGPGGTGKPGEGVHLHPRFPSLPYSDRAAGEARAGHNRAGCA